MEDEVSAKFITMPALNFMQLVDVIRKVHDDLSAQASRAVNASLTLRNWLIGFYVEEYERQGVDRTEYGDKLMDRLAESLTMYGVSRCERRELYRYRQLYLVYPQIVESLSPQSEPFLSASVFAVISEPVVATRIVETSPQFRIDGRTLISRLSFSHIIELVNLDRAEKRAFYEIECIQGNWSVRDDGVKVNYQKFGQALKKIPGLDAKEE